MECPICFDEVDPNDFPSIVKVCRCNLYYHISCFKLLKDDRCHICLGSFIETLEELPSYQQSQELQHQIAIEDTNNRINNSMKFVCYLACITICVVGLIPLLSLLFDQ